MNKMDWYVLFVLTGKEHKVEKLLKKSLDQNVFIPFIPLQERLFKISGSIKKEIKPLFPGYVFIESETSSQEFIKNIKIFISISSDIISILRYADNSFAMRYAERQMLLSLCNEDHCIESSSGIIVGERVHITDGPLKDRESIVRKVNRHKRQAWIEIEFMGEIRLIGVALDVVEKIIS